MSALLDEEEAIRRLLADYCFIAETGQPEKWAGLFAENGVWDAGHVGRFVGRAAILEFIRRGDSSKDRHRLSNTVIEINGDQARALSSVTLYHSTRELGYKLIGGGYYADHLVKLGGRWHFAERRYLPKLKPSDLLP